jgi:hypothetical protein
MTESLHAVYRIGFLSTRVARGDAQIFQTACKKLSRLTASVDRC